MASVAKLLDEPAVLGTAALTTVTKRRFSVMTTAIIGTGGIGSAISRLLASGGESVRLSNADPEPARMLAEEIGAAAIVSADNRDALLGADAVVLALRFTVLQGVIDGDRHPAHRQAGGRSEQPLRTDEQGHVLRVLPDSQSSGEAVSSCVWVVARTP